MNKELGRKITSLTLMTIMLTWTATMSFTGFMPEAEAANQYLWVSVEDSGNNKFYGGQVLEIVVTDPAINRLDEAYGMPDVTIDGKKVIMAQGVDGSWYAYIADGKKATGIDGNYAEVEDGKGADYGRWCESDTNLEYAPYAGAVKSVATLIPSESRGVAIPHQLPGDIGASTFSSYSQGTGISGTGAVDCDNDDASTSSTSPFSSQGYYLNSTARGAHGTGLATGVNASDQAVNNVVREARALSNGTTTDFYGNIGLGPNLWPFIQLYDFTRYQTYDLVYERGGADEVISLTYDRPGSGISFDKEHYGLNHEVGVTITSNEFNIDPTDEDSWTFGTLPTNATTFYQMFDENGNNDSAATSGVKQFTMATAQSTWGFDTGVLKIDVNGPEDASTSVLYFQDNADQVVACSSGLCGVTSSGGKGTITTASQAVSYTHLTLPTTPYV